MCGGQQARRLVAAGLRSLPDGELVPEGRCSGTIF